MSQALPLVAYPDLENQVKAMEGRRVMPIFQRLLTRHNSRNFAMRWIDSLRSPESFDRHSLP